MAWPWKKDIDNEKRAPRILMKMKHKVSHRGFRTQRAEDDLKSLGVKNGMTVVDFGCGTGIYTVAAAKIVGEKGTVHAVDLHPTLLEMIEKKGKEMGLSNIDTIYSDLETGVDENSVDVVIFYDVLKNIKRVRELLDEANRIVKNDGTLVVRQSRMKEDRIKEMVLKDGFFIYTGKKGKTLKFRRIKGAFHEIS